MSSPEQASDLEPDFTPPTPPLHGFRGNRGRLASVAQFPAGLTIALSREAGARGASIAKRVGKKLGWQVYNQELLEYISGEATFRDNLLADLPAAALRWAEERLAHLQEAEMVGHDPDVINLVRTILAVGVQGEVV